MSVDSVNDVIDVKEVLELVRYASYVGVDKEHKTLGPLCAALRKFEEEQDNDKKRKIACEFLKLYADLCRLTHPVNGGTLIDTSNISSHLRNIYVVTIFFLVASFGNEIADVYFNKTAPGSGGLEFLRPYQDHIFDYLSPFFWGGLGACVYLLKRLSDLATARTFFSKILHGWRTRILLGAILGTVAQILYEPKSFTDGELHLDANAVAFLAGVGTRVVYGAIEKLIDLLAQKMNLDTIRGSDTMAPVRNWLSGRLSETDKDKEPEKHGTITGLIDDIDRATRTN